MKVTVKVGGLRDLDAALLDLEKRATRRTVARRALAKAAAPMVDAAQAPAPVLSGALKMSIHAGTKTSDGNAGKAAFAKVMREGGSRAQAGAALRAVNAANAGTVWMHVGPGQHPQAIMQEFGTMRHQPQPFMRPAWEQTKGGMIEIITRELRVEIDKAVARAAARAARAARV